MHNSSIMGLLSEMIADNGEVPGMCLDGLLSLTSVVAQLCMWYHMTLIIMHILVLFIIAVINVVFNITTFNIIIIILIIIRIIIIIIIIISIIIIIYRLLRLMLHIIIPIINPYLKILYVVPLNPSNAEATFNQNTRTQRKPSKSFHVGINWIALPEYSQMSTQVSGFQSFFRFFASFCIGQISHH